MPAPFPGMDPYLEGELWQEFHETLAGAIRAQLMPRLAPQYVALLAKRYALDRPALGVFDALARAPSTAPMQGQGGIAVPAVELPSFLEVPQLSVEIRDVAERRLVTVIEILSPANKYGDGAREYLDQRTDLLRTETHLLEHPPGRGTATGALLRLSQPLAASPLHAGLAGRLARAATHRPRAAAAA